MNTDSSTGETDPLGQWPAVVDSDRIISFLSIRREFYTFSIHQRYRNECLNLCMKNDTMMNLKLNNSIDKLKGKK
jgi:hypothetical protein